MKFKFLLFLVLFFPAFVSAKTLDVPFISQVPPGDWESTLNCGQASYYMADAFLSGNADLNSEDIKKIDDFLYDNFSDPIRDYNGYYTTTSKLKSVAEDLGGYKNVFTSRLSNDFESIKKAIDEGSLVIPLVRVSMKLDKDGHYMLMTGFDDEKVYFNDPGKTLGKNREYSIEDFLDVWESENYSYLTLEKETIIENVVVGGGSDGVEEGSVDDKNILPTSQSQSIVKSFQDIVSNVVEFAGKVASNYSSSINNASNVGNANSTNPVFPTVSNNLNTPTAPTVSTVNSSIGYGYGYGYGNNSDNASNETEDGSIIVPNISLPEFYFKPNYVDKKLVIPLEFNFVDSAVDISKYKFFMDYKIGNDGGWINEFSNYGLSSYKYYVKTNGDTYYFRLKVCDASNNCSLYKEVNQRVYLEPASDKMLLGSDGNDVVMDGDEYFNVCFDIEPDQIFLIKKGTKIKLTPGCSITVSGLLFAMGEDDSRILITSTSTAFANYWSFIMFENSFGSFLENVDFEYGGYYYMKGYTYPEIMASNSILTLNKVNFIKNIGSGGAVYVYGNSAFYMYNSVAKDFVNGNAVDIRDSIGVVENNVFNNNSLGMYLYNVDDRLKIINNKFSNNRLYPVYGENIFAYFENNIFKDNGSDIIFQSINLITKGDFKLLKNIYKIWNVSVEAGANLIIEKGTILKMESNFGVFNINGSIQSIGDPANPIVFTSIYDDDYGGDINKDGGARKPAMGDWGYINLNFSKSSSNFKNSIFRFAGVNDDQFFGAININYSNNISIEDSVFDTNYYGVKVDGSNHVSINNCKFYDNFYGIHSTDSVNFSTSANYYQGNVVEEVR